MSLQVIKDHGQLIDQLIDVAPGPARQKMVHENPELQNRNVALELADTVNRLAREDLTRAECAADAAMWVADLLNDDFCRARAGRSAGNLQALRGKYEDAIRTFENSLALFRKVGDEIEEAATLSASLQPLIYLSRYSEAHQRARDAQKIAERHQDELLLARVNINAGNIFHRQDCFTEAAARYTRAVLGLEKLGRPRDCAIAWVNLAVCYISLNDFLQAENAYRKARVIAEEENMPAIAAQADYNIAYLHYYRGEHTQAINLYQKTRLYCEQTGDLFHSALCDLDQAEMYLELHLNNEGVQLAEKAISSFEKLNMAYEAAKALVWVGVGAYQNLKPPAAIDVFSKAQKLMVAEQNLAWTAVLDLYQALILQQEGRIHEALRSCGAAQRFFSAFPDSGKAAHVELLYASLYLALGNVETALKSCKVGTGVAERLQSSHLLAHAYWTRGRIEEYRHLTHEASRFYLLAIASLEATPNRLAAEDLKIPFAKNRFDMYEGFVSLAPTATQAESEIVFQNIEKAKSRELAELISFRANSLSTPSRNRSGLVEQVKALRGELNWYYRQVDKADLRTSEQVAEQSQQLRHAIRTREEMLLKTMGQLRVTEEEFHALHVASTTSTEEIRNVLSDDELIIEYYQARGVIYACLLGKKALRIVPLTPASAVRDLLRSFRSQLSKFELGHDYVNRFDASLICAAQASLRSLYTELIAPLQEYLVDYRLIFAPDGPLHYLPFHALFDGSRYLCESHIISYAGSASLFYLASRRTVGQQDHDLVLGGVNSDAKDCGMTASEIARLVPNSRTFTGSQVGIRTLEAQGPGSRFIHLITRMNKRLDNPLFSTLALGDDELSILDLYSLRMPCSLVGLSWSGPGLTSSGNGVDVLSLGHGIEYAGGQSVLMPLWNIRGQAASLFVETFYRSPSCENDKPLALQKTMAIIREQFPHPFNWASFILRGKTGR
jgi:CHAT domain-containing protein